MKLEEIEAIEGAVLVYGIQTGRNPFDRDMSNVVYGVQTGGGQQEQPAPDRDEWWHMLAKLGIISAAAYGVYKMVTGGK